MVATAYLDFKDPTTTFPWIRAGALAVNLSSPICKDGMGKLLVKSDLEKLKHQTQRPQLLIAEKALQVNYELLQKAGKHQSPPGLSTMGRALVRTILFLTKNSTRGEKTMSSSLCKRLPMLLVKNAWHWTMGACQLHLLLAMTKLPLRHLLHSRSNS